MYWILAAVFIIVALVVPRLRPLGVAGLIVLGTFLGWAVVQRLRSDDPQQRQTVERRARPISPAAVVHSVPVASIDVKDLRLTGGGAPFELKGRIVNKTPDVLVKSVTIRVTRRDCYEGAIDPTGCVRLWQDQPWISISVPPLQARDFGVSIWMHGSAPRPRGKVDDTFELLAATGEVVAAVEKEDE